MGVPGKYPLARKEGPPRKRRRRSLLGLLTRPLGPQTIDRLVKGGLEDPRLVLVKQFTARMDALADELLGDSFQVAFRHPFVGADISEGVITKVLHFNASIGECAHPS